jgi:hypothetical protein
MVEVIGDEVALVAVNEGVFPVPLAARPIAVLLFVHAKVAPVTGLVNADAATEPPLHTVILAGTTTVGVGLIVIV